MHIYQGSITSLLTFVYKNIRLSGNNFSEYHMWKPTDRLTEWQKECIHCSIACYLPNNGFILATI